MIDEDQLRQLTERAILGKANVSLPSVTEQELFIENRGIPSYKAYSFNKNANYDLKEINEDISIITFYSSFCASCKAGQRIDTLNDIKNRLIKDKSIVNVLVIFTEPFSQEDIGSLVEIYRIPSDVFAGKQILPLDQLYITDDSKRNNPLTVVIRQGIIRFVEKVGTDEKSLTSEILKCVQGDAFAKLGNSKTR